jgi:hypothetical protein
VSKSKPKDLKFKRVTRFKAHTLRIIWKRKIQKKKSKIKHESFVKEKDPHNIGLDALTYKYAIGKK